MATAQPMPAQGPPAVRGTLPVQATSDPAAEQTRALTLPGDEAPIFNSRVVRLPVELDVVVPVREFRVRNLLALEPGQTVESRWGNGEDVPLAAGAERLAWGEFEVIDNQLAVRVTRLD